MCNGIFGIFYTAFGWLLKLCCNIGGGYYIFGLLIFSIIVQIVLIPLGIKQQKSSVKQAKLAPKVALIKEKYKGRNDRPTQQKMQQEINDLYQKEGFSMFSGCLVLLIQLPLVLIIYGIVRMPISYTADTNVDVKSQYEVAVNILDGAIDAIDETNLLNDVKDDAVPEGSLGDLYNLRKSYANIVKAFVGEDLIDNKGKWNGEAFEVNTNYEFTLAEFVVTDFRTEVIDDLTKILDENGVDDYKTIIEKNIKPEYAFNEQFVESIPKFTYLGGEETLLDTPRARGFSSLLIVPLLVFISSVLSYMITQKFSPNANGQDGQSPTNGFIFKWGFPLFSTFLAWSSFPAAIGVYWFYSTVLRTAQTYVLAKVIPVPVLSEEELEEFKKQMKGKKKKVITIEVDEDDNTYDHLKVERSDIKSDEKTGEKSNSDSVSSGYQMLSADDKDLPETKVDWVSPDNNKKSSKKDENSGDNKKEG